MKKFIPLILLGVGIIVVVFTFLVVRGSKVKEEPTNEETALFNVPLNERPVVSLTPSSDGHYLNLKVEKIVIEAKTLEYELLYKVPQGVLQGVPGSISLQGKDSFETELLLGSESSGKFRYDEGVEEGTLTIRFRNNDGKLITKFVSDFHMQSETGELTSIDGSFKYIPKVKSKDFFVTMVTIGIPDDKPGEISSGPYGVFSSSGKSLSGKVEIDSGSVYQFTSNKWTSLLDGESSDIGIFVVVE